MKTLLSHSQGLKMIGFVILTILSGCSQDQPLHPTYEELQQQGFYVYVLPKNEVESQEWSQDITIWSWNRHCRGIEPAEISNPINITYQTKTGEPRLSLIIGFRSMLWDHRQPVSEVKLDFLGINKAVYHKTNDYVYLRFNDQLGIPVQVISGLPLDETVNLINQLEYRGPPGTVTNPWAIDKCSTKDRGQFGIYNLVCLSLIVPGLLIYLMSLLFRFLERKLIESE